MAISFDAAQLTAKPTKSDALWFHPGDFRESPEHNSRSEMSKDGIARMVSSYRKVGFNLQPIRAVKVDDGDGKFHLEPVCGYRRVAAGKVYIEENPDFRLQAIVVSSRYLSDEDRLIENIHENEFREDVTPLDRAHTMQRLVAEFGYNAKRLADLYSMSENNVRNYLRLAEIPDAIKERFRKGKLTMVDAIKLAKVQDAAKVNETLAAVDAAHDAPVVTEEKPDGAPTNPAKPTSGKKKKSSSQAIKETLRADGQNKAMSLAELRAWLKGFKHPRAVDLLKVVNGEMSGDDYAVAHFAGK